MKVLVTGATGYIGGRLVPYLLEAGHEVRCATRQPARLDLAPWRSQVEVVYLDALERASIVPAMEGCDVAFYLIHSMAAPGVFADADRVAAENFATAAPRAGLKRIVYLGGLGRDDDLLSKHLKSRHEVGRILAAGSVPVTELRAALIIGSGSVSFEMIRHITEVVPVMMRPKWFKTRCQPISVRNVLQILVEVLDRSVEGVVEIGGPDVLTYEEMIHGYAEVAGLRKRLVIPLPIFNLRLSTVVTSMITPLPISVVGPLLASLSNNVVADDPVDFGIELLTYTEALALALQRTDERFVPTRWTDAVKTPEAPMPQDPVWAGERMLLDRKDVATRASAEDLYWAVSRIGGDVGYYVMGWAWQARGFIDHLVGGVGLRRGRRHPEELRLGEAVDFWRVVALEPGRLLRLQAEMRLPGTAWLEWRIIPTPRGSRLVQLASFVPRGLIGRIYWWSLLMFHAPIFGRMAKRIARTAEYRRANEVTIDPRDRRRTIRGR